MAVPKPRVLYIVTEDWYFCSHRLPIARAARESGFEVVVATRVANHGERIRQEGFRLIPIRMRRRELRPWREISTLWEILGICRTERPDLVHSVAMKPVLYGAIAAWVSSVPAVVNALAGLGYVFSSKHSGIGLLLRPLIMLAFGRLLSFPNSRVIVQNPDDKGALQRVGVPQERIAVIRGSGVDTSVFVPMPEPERDIVVTMVSRMLWDKGVLELVEAARILKRSHPNITVKLVGFPDPENPSSIPEDQLQAWSREGLIEWSGPSEDIPGIWACSHIAVLPSYREGLPKSLLEAAACGRPIVATDVPGCREIVRHGENGFLVPPKDAGAIASAILRMAKDRGLRRRLGAQGRKMVATDYSEKRVVWETLALYRSVLGVRWPQ